MKKSLIALAVLGASSVAFAASNVTLYGVIETGVLAQKVKHSDTTVSMKSGFVSGPRWGIKGTEELGNGYSVGFILEQGFKSDDGSEAVDGKQFSREAILYVDGGFGRFAAGRTGTLGSGMQTFNQLTGWAFTTSWGLSSWTSYKTAFDRVNNALVYQTPSFSGLTLTAMYSNGIEADETKWSKNNHYYGIAAKYQANAITSSLVFEALDNKGTGTAEKKAGDFLTLNEYGLENEWADPANPTAAEKAEYEAWAKTVMKKADPDKKRAFIINYGLEYNLGAVTPMFAYQWYNQDGGKKTNMFGLSAKVAVAGGDALFGGRYIFGHDESITKGDDKVRGWNIGAAYRYPLSNRTQLKAYAGYADASKGWKNTEDVAMNGYQVYLGMSHTF